MTRTTVMAASLTVIVAMSLLTGLSTTGAASKRKPDCIGLVIDTHKPNCNWLVPMSPLFGYAAAVNTKTLSQQLRRQGVSRSDRLDLTTEIRSYNRDRARSQGKKGRRSKSWNAVTACLVFGTAGAALGLVDAAIQYFLGQDFHLSAIVGAGFVGCLGKAVADPVGKKVAEQLSRKYKL